MSRGDDVTIRNHASSTRMKAVAHLIKYAPIASNEELKAITDFEESSRIVLKESDSNACGRRVLEVFMRSTTQDCIETSSQR